MKRAGMVAGVLAVVVIALIGCDVLRPSTLSPKSADGTFSALVQAQEDGTGWVNVTVSGVPQGDYRLHFGDSYEDWSYMEVSGNGVYGHFYARPGAYVVSVLPFVGGSPVVRGVAEVHSTSYHFVVQGIDGWSVTFAVYGVCGTAYRGNGGVQEGIYLLWFGDGGGVRVDGNDALPIIVTHAYPSAGTYTAVLQPGNGIGAKADQTANFEVPVSIAGGGS